MDSLFQKTLTDVVKLSRTTSSYDQLTFQAQLASEIKNEFKNKNDQVKQYALLKLFFLAMEGQSIKWAEFNVINSMGSSDYYTRRIAYLIAHQVLDQNSQGLIMVTNVIKKEIQKSSNTVECSCALSCLGNICNKDLGESLLSQVISL